jgi:hypothetical protein
LVGVVVIGWSVPAGAQTQQTAPVSTETERSVSPLSQPRPEPEQQLLTPSPPLPRGDVPLLRRVVPGLADWLNDMPPFIRDASIKVHPRTFYFNRLNSNDTQNEAWAIGGWVEVQSGWLLDMFRAGAVGYTSQPLYAPDDSPGTNLLHPPQDPIVTLGQLYGQVRYKEYALITGYRQLVDEGYVNPNDNRMVPNTFEGVTIKGAFGPVGYNVGYLTALKQRQEQGFHNVAEVAGARDSNQGLILTRLSTEPLKGLTFYGANYYIPDVYNTAYGNVEFKHEIVKDLSFLIGIQLTDQRSVGGERAGDFSTLSFGTRGGVLWRGLTAGGAIYTTGSGAALKTPFGSWPGYLSFQEKDFDRAGENAWGLGAKYDFGGGSLLPFNIPGLTVLLRYATGTDARNTGGNNGALPRVHEGDFDVTWNVPWVKGFQIRFRNAYVEDGGKDIVKAFRIILNYEIPIL